MFIAELRIADRHWVNTPIFQLFLFFLLFLIVLFAEKTVDFYNLFSANFFVLFNALEDSRSDFFIFKIRLKCVNRHIKISEH